MNNQGFYTAGSLTRIPFLVRTPMRRDPLCCVGTVCTGCKGYHQRPERWQLGRMADAPQLFRLLGGRRCRGDARHLLPIPCVWRRRQCVEPLRPLRYGHDTAPRWPQHCVGRTHLPVDGFRLDGKAQQELDAPLNIYEAQAGSWRCKEDGTPYTYSELAKQLPAYLKETATPTWS